MVKLPHSHLETGLQERAEASIRRLERAERLGRDQQGQEPHLLQRIRDPPEAVREIQQRRTAPHVSSRDCSFDQVLRRKESSAISVDNEENWRSEGPQ